MTGDNLIEDLMNEITYVETPRSWIWWSIVTAISASCGNNYYVRTFKGNVTYKPNLYVMLLGESGLGKSFPINLAKLLVQKIEFTRVIAGRSSIQAIVSELAKSKTNNNGKPPIMDSRGFIINGELSSAVIADVDSLSILTDLYDGNVNEEWTNLLKISGAEKLKEPYITALFGSSPALFYESIPQPNIEGGYIGRNLIVYEEKRSQNIDVFSDDDDEVDDRVKEIVIPKYAKHLDEIASHKGRLILTRNAKDLYNPWRHKWRATQPPDKTGFINRVPDHVIKVAICLCLSRYSNGGVINEFDIQEAIDKVTGLIYANKLTTAGRGLDPLAAQTKIVLDLLIRAEGNELTRKRLLSLGHGNYDTFTLDKIIETLLEMDWVKRERIVAGKNSDWSIKLSGEPLESYNRWQRDQKR